jgi:hypothetical protein
VDQQVKKGSVPNSIFQGAPPLTQGPNGRHVSGQQHTIKGKSGRGNDGQQTNQK